MIIDITKAELISGLIGVVIGYKGKTLIQGRIVGITKGISNVIAPK